MCTLSQGVMPLVYEMNASLQSERGKGMYYVSKIFICHGENLQICVQRPKIYQENMFTYSSVRRVNRCTNTEMSSTKCFRVDKFIIEGTFYRSRFSHLSMLIVGCARKGIPNFRRQQNFVRSRSCCDITRRYVATDIESHCTYYILFGI